MASFVEWTKSCLPVTAYYGFLGDSIFWVYITLRYAWSFDGFTALTKLRMKACPLCPAGSLFSLYIELCKLAHVVQIAPKLPLTGTTDDGALTDVHSTVIAVIANYSLLLHHLLVFQLYKSARDYKFSIMTAGINPTEGQLRWTLRELPSRRMFRVLVRQTAEN